MIAKFLNKNEDEVLLMYVSKGYCNNSGQGDRGVIGNLYSPDEINKYIQLWNNEVSANLKDTRLSLYDLYEKKSISLTEMVYRENGEEKTIFNDSEENEAIIENIRMKDELETEDVEILDIYDFHAKISIEDNELKLYLSNDSAYQTISKYITIKKVKKDNVRYCVIIERPVNSRECGQFILAGPYINYDEAKSLVKEFSSEKDIYGIIRNPYVIATYVDDRWLKNHYKKNGISNKN